MKTFGLPPLILSRLPLLGCSNCESQVNGFLAEGSRLKKTIPADKVGNERPLEIFSETWFSQQLQTVIQHRTIDPRFGTTEYKLIEIELGDPAQELFVTPKSN